MSAELRTRGIDKYVDAVRDRPLFVARTSDPELFKLPLKTKSVAVLSLFSVFLSPRGGRWDQRASRIKIRLSGIVSAG